MIDKRIYLVCKKLQEEMCEYYFSAILTTELQEAIKNAENS